MACIKNQRGVATESNTSGITDYSLRWVLVGETERCTAEEVADLLASESMECAVMEQVDSLEAAR